MSAKQKTRKPWLTVGAQIAEIAYLGRGHYDARPVTVARTSKAMVFTTEGRRYWLDGPMYEVGGRDRQLITRAATVYRLVPRDNPYAAHLFTEEREPGCAV